MCSAERAHPGDDGAAGARTAVLAIELSQRSGSVALRVGGLTTVRAVPAASNDRDELMPAIQALVHDAGCVPADIGTVMVSIGPGGFTGLRVSIATAKALALALDARVVGVPSALVVARCIAQRDGIRDGTVGVALSAKADTAWFERVELAAGKPICRNASVCTAADAPFEGLAAIVADEFLPSAWSDRAACEGVQVLSARWDAAVCMEVGDQLQAAEGVADPRSLEPIYPRPPEAVTLWNARKQRSGAGGTA